MTQYTTPIAVAAVFATGLLLAGCGGPAPGPVVAATSPEAPVAMDKPQVAAAGEVPAVLGPLPPPAVLKDVPPALAKVFAERNQRHLREAGARLTIAAKWVKNPGVEQGIRVEWAIDYAGPRRPFVIATPGRWTDPAVAHFWYLKPDGTANAFTWGVGGGVPFGPLPLKEKGMFSAAADGRPLAGRLQAGGGSSLKVKMEREPRPGDPSLWVQLEYVAEDRGDGEDVALDPLTGGGKWGPTWTFDAWTGHLWSPVVEVGVE